MIQFVDDLVDYLQTQGLGTKAVDMFKGNGPESGENILVVTDTGGSPNTLNLRVPGNIGVEQVTVQIRARANRQEVARDRLLEIQALLHQIENTDLGTFTIISGQAVDRPAVIGRDPKERWSVVSNYEFLIRNS